MRLADMRTDIDLVRPATATGMVDSASFQWSVIGCPAAVKLKFFRRQGDTLIFLEERGPFDAAAVPTPVTLTPPVAVQEGDLIGITRLTTCGNPAAVSGFPSAGYVVYTGDVNTNVSLSLAEFASPDVLAVSATGTASESLTRVIPGAASTPGNFGSFFRTTVQLHNPWGETVSGRFVYHPQGSPDLLPTRASTSRSSRVRPRRFPTSWRPWEESASARSTSCCRRAQTRRSSSRGCSTTPDRLEPPASGRTHGQSDGSSGVRYIVITGFLVAPPDLTNFRFNIGVRTFLSGAFITFRVHDSTGALVQEISKAYGPTFYEQRSSNDFLGGGSFALAPNDTIEVSVSTGSAVVYGATTDNTTNDPSIQFVKVAFAILLKRPFSPQPRYHRPVRPVVPFCRGFATVDSFPPGEGVHCSLSPSGRGSGRGVFTVPGARPVRTGRRLRNRGVPPGARYRAG